MSVRDEQKPVNAIRARDFVLTIRNGNEAVGQVGQIHRREYENQLVASELTRARDKPADFDDVGSNAKASSRLDTVPSASMAASPWSSV